MWFLVSEVQESAHLTMSGSNPGPVLLSTGARRSRSWSWSIPGPRWWGNPRVSLSGCCSWGLITIVLSENGQNFCSVMEIWPRSKRKVKSKNSDMGHLAR